MRSSIINSVNKKTTVMDPFHEFHPIKWDSPELDCDSENSFYCIKRNHGVQGTFKLHNLNDAINDHKDAFDKIIIEYVINGSSYTVFTVADMLNSPYSLDQNSEGNILGDLAERIARRVTKCFLKHLNKLGKTGGIFDQRFDPRNREDFIVANTNDFILKIQQYPNLIILKRTGRGMYGYENIKELDGFFDYRYMGQRHILVLESKLERINVDCSDLISNLFVPLRSLFPEAKFSYILFTDKSSIFVRSTYERWRQIKQLPVRIYDTLNQEGIGTLFFTFNECREDFERMKDFIITQYRAVKKLGVTIYGKTMLTEKELTIFDGGETPHIKLIKDFTTGLWREIPLRHKKGL